MNNIGFLWVLLLITLIMIYNFMYIKDQRSLLLLIVLIFLFSLYSTNMNEILFMSLFIVCGFNLVQTLNVANTSVEYHVINRIKYINESGIFLKEKTSIQSEIYDKPTEEWLDIHQMIYNWNKSIPTID